MTYQELVNQIRDFGFAEDSEMEDFGQLVANDINHSIRTINMDVDPIVEHYEFVIDDTDTGFLYLSMPDVDEKFIDFGDTPVRVQMSGKDSYAKFSDFDIENGDTLVINADKNKGTFRVFYKATHVPFTGTELTEEVPLKLRVHHLVPLLAGYYIWLDDEPVKAAQYYNLYEQGVKTFMETSTGNRPRMRVLKGGI